LSGECTVRVRFHQPSPALRRYFTTFYLTELDVADGGRVEDFIHPEWGGVRMVQGVLPEGGVLGGAVFGGIANIGQGPTSMCIRHRSGTARIWGFGLLPAGWARFVPTPASTLADSVFDAQRQPAFAAFRPMMATLFDKGSDEAAELARIEQHFLGRLDEPALDPPSPDEPRIFAVHDALMDTDIANVHDMADAAGMKTHTLERLSRRYFGFAPSLLLRRQRFMRSLAQYVMDPSLKWIGAIDPHYHDQAQFVRDFHRFMGMSPREYVAMPHPILDAVMHARAVSAGAAVQALHKPGAADPVATA